MRKLSAQLFLRSPRSTDRLPPAVVSWGDDQMSGPSGELASQWQLVRRQAQRPDVLDRHAERVAERFVLFVRQVFLLPEGGHGAQRRRDRPRQVAVLERQTRHPSVAIGGNAVPRTEGGAPGPVGRGGPMCPAGRGVARGSPPRGRSPAPRMRPGRRGRRPPAGACRTSVVSHPGHGLTAAVPDVPERAS